MPSLRSLLLAVTALTVAIVVVIGVVMTPSAASSEKPGADAKPEPAKAQGGKEDFNALQGVFGAKRVTVFWCPNNTSASSVVSVKITGTVTVFGRQFLRLEQKSGEPMLIRADQVTTIRKD
jgi:hypothetical protein